MSENKRNNLQRFILFRRDSQKKPQRYAKFISLIFLICVPKKIRDIFNNKNISLDQLLTHLPEKLLFQKLYKEPKLWSKKDSYILIQCPKNGRSGHCLKTIEQTT